MTHGDVLLDPLRVLALWDYDDPLLYSPAERDLAWRRLVLLRNAHDVRIVEKHRFPVVLLRATCMLSLDAANTAIRPRKCAPRGE